MWIKVLFCTSDTDYAGRLSYFFEREYGDKISLDTCSVVQNLVPLIEKNKPDVVLIDEEEYQKDKALFKKLLLPKAVLSDKASFYDEDSEVRQIPKYQRADDIYKDMLELYSDSGNIRRIKSLGSAGKNRIFAFVASKGGVGTTTVALSYAEKCAPFEKVLFLNLSPYYVSLDDKKSEGGFDDILFALRSRRNLLSVKLMSAVSESRDRVYSFCECSDPLELLGLSGEDIEKLLSGIREIDEYNKIIVDLGSAATAYTEQVLKEADRIIYVTDEDRESRPKTERFEKLLENISRKNGIRLLSKTRAFRNKVQEDFGGSHFNSSIKLLGYAPLVKDADTERDILNRIINSDSLDGLGDIND